MKRKVIETDSVFRVLAIEGEFRITAPSENGLSTVNVLGGARSSALGHVQGCKSSERGVADMARHGYKAKSTMQTVEQRLADARYRLRLVEDLIPGLEESRSTRALAKVLRDACRGPLPPAQERKR